MKDRDAKTPQPRRRRWGRILGALVLGLILVLLLGALWARGRLAASLAVLDGEVALPGLSAPVTVERDALGVPTVSGRDRRDLARATGFLHAQDRFFQMDLLRRLPAGELSALVGAGALEIDRDHRIHRFRARAGAVLETASEADRQLLAAYAEGVNGGLAALREKPFEYLLLRAQPEPWRPEDSMLAVYAMYLDLQGEQFPREAMRGLLHDHLPPALASFLDPPGTSWDAPVEGPGFGDPVLPTAEQLQIAPGAEPAPVPELAGTEPETRFSPGSNNFAVGGSRTRHGGALVANDMHLGINVPPIWYRLSLVLEAPGATERRITGVTLPGAPVMVVASNGDIAWGFTNSNGDWADLVVVEEAGDGRYLTPEGPRAYERFQERIEVKDGEAETLEVLETLWGPLYDQDHEGRDRALSWVAHHPQGANLRILDLEQAETVDEALEVAHRTGIPAQNFVVGDRRGEIAWTIIGALPRRHGHDGRLPSSWADGSRGWDGWLEPEEVPVLRTPEDGVLWTANARVVSGDSLAKLGDGGYVLGARAAQIRDGLRAGETFTAQHLLEIQLDDRALFLAPWRELLLEVLEDLPGEAGAEAGHGEMQRLVEDWGGRATVESAGYRLVKAYRSFVEEEVLLGLTAPCNAADPRFDPLWLRQTEGALWQLVTRKPPHLLPETAESWDALLSGAVERTLHYFEGLGGELADHTWGARNTSRFRHPLSRAVPALSRFLDVPPTQLPGDEFLPRFQSPAGGASERMVVSPGREDEGIFHMPGGQSGHPMSPFYHRGFDAWAAGEPTAFLPGPAEHRLTLRP